MAKQYRLEIKVDSSSATKAAERLLSAFEKIEAAAGRMANGFEGFANRAASSFNNVGAQAEKSARASAASWTNSTRTSSAGFTTFRTAGTSAANAVAVSMSTAGATTVATMGMIGSSGGNALAKINLLNAGIVRTRVEALATASALSGMGRPATAIGNTAGKVAMLGSNLKSAGSSAGVAASAFGGAGGAAGGMGGHFNSAAGDAGRLDSNIGRLILRIGGLMLLRKAVGEVGNAMRDAREHGEQKADESLDRRDKARALSQLMGETGPNDRVMGRVFGVGLSSGLNFDESLDLLKQFEGSAPMAVQKGHLREDQKLDVATEAARSAVRFGLDPKTVGDAAGVIGQHIDLNKQKGADGKMMTAKEAVAGQLASMFHGAAEGRGDESTIMRNMIAQAASAIPTGRISGMPEMSAWEGTVSYATKSAASTGTAYGQISRFLNKEDDATADFMQRAGVDKEEGDLNKLKAVAKHINKIKASQGGKLDVNKYLAGEGFHSDPERKMIAAMLENIPELEKRIAQEKARAMRGGEAVQLNEASQGELTTQNRLSKVRVEAAEYDQNRVGERLQIARRNAAAGLEKAGILNRADQKFNDAMVSGFGIKQFLGMKPEDQVRIDAEVDKNIVMQAKNRGIDLIGQGKAFINSKGQPELVNKDGNGRSETINSLSEQGVNVFGGDAGLGAQMRFDDASPEERARRNAARLPQGAAKAAPPNPLNNGPVLPGVPAGVPGVQVGPLGVGGNPQATNEGNDLLRQQVAIMKQDQARASRMRPPPPMPLIWSPNVSMQRV